MTRVIWRGAAAGIVLGLLIVWIWGMPGRAPMPVNGAPPATPVAAIPSVPATAPLAIGANSPASGEPNLRVTNDVRVYQMTKDAVVNISSTRVVTARVSSGDEVFDRFFGGQIRQVPAQSL